MSKLAEYRDIKDQPRSKTTVLDSRENKRRWYRLIQATEGWEPAGSMARWTDAYFAVQFNLDGATHGRRFRSLDEAKRIFDTWTNS